MFVLYRKLLFRNDPAHGARCKSSGLLKNDGIRVVTDKCQYPGGAVFEVPSYGNVCQMSVKCLSKQGEKRIRRKR